MTTEQLIIDQRLPHWEVELAKHRLVHAAPEETWRVARDLDLLMVHTPLLDAAMWVRALPDCLTGRTLPTVPQVTLGGDCGDVPGWVSLGQQDNREIAAGAVGKFWQPRIIWRTVPTADFTAFVEPGWGKIATSITTLPYGDGTMLSYVCRVATTDDGSHRRFVRYWWAIRPFVAHIMGAAVRAIAMDAERQPSASTAKG